MAKYILDGVVIIQLILVDVCEPEKIDGCWIVCEVDVFSHHYRISMCFFDGLLLGATTALEVQPRPSTANGK
jgi:hypothetical protein